SAGRAPGRGRRDRRWGRFGHPRAGRELPRRATLERGGDPLRLARSAAALPGAAAVRPGRPLQPAGPASARDSLTAAQASPAEHALVADASRDAVGVEALEQQLRGPARTPDQIAEPGESDAISDLELLHEQGLGLL